MTKRLLQTRNSLSVNKDMVSRQNIRKKEHIIVKGVTHMISDSTMNGIFYPEGEVKILADNIGTARVTMPASHPTGENGEFISASDPWALTSNFIGAYAFNFSIQGDKLISDVAIDPLFAATNEDGIAIMNAIENGEPVDISTGFYLNVEDESGIGKDGEPYQMIASNLHIDHSAFLPNEVGAKNKLEGVGLHTNSALTLDGKTIDTDVALLQVNASTPAMQLPLANETYQWSESKALINIREYTGSNEQPSSNYRKFFLEFDQDDVGNFEAYKYPFADIIDGKPHAVKAPVTSMREINAHAMTYHERFEEVAGDNGGIMNKALNWVKSIFSANELSHDNIHEKIYSKLNANRDPELHSMWPVDIFETYFVYRGDNDKLYEQSYIVAEDELFFTKEPVEVIKETTYTRVFNNKPESIMDKAKLIALLAANGITANADMSDADLEAALNTALSDKPAETVVDTATNDQITALTATVNSLAATVLATSNKELDTAVTAVVAMNKGIDEAAAKAMGLTACNAFLAANGQPAFSVHGGQHQQNNQDSVSADLPD